MAESMSPPLHPSLPYSFLAQSTSCCTERERSVPFSMAASPSRDPIVEKAQQDPQDPWFLTGVTAPFSPQLTSEGGFGTGLTCPQHFFVIDLALSPKQRALYSSTSRSAKAFISRSQISNPLLYLALCSLTKTKLSLNLLNLKARFSSDMYALWYFSVHEVKRERRLISSLVIRECESWVGLGVKANSPATTAVTARASMILSLIIQQSLQAITIFYSDISIECSIFSKIHRGHPYLSIISRWLPHPPYCSSWLQPPTASTSTPILNLSVSISTINTVSRRLSTMWQETLLTASIQQSSTAPIESSDTSATPGTPPHQKLKVDLWFAFPLSTTPKK